MNQEVTLDYKSQAERVIARMQNEYGYLHCELCGRINCNLHTHHIVYKSEAAKHPELHNERNLILVCADGIGYHGCHEKLHADKKKREKLVQERNLKELFPNII